MSEDSSQPQLMKGLYILHVDGGKRASKAGEGAQGAFGFALRDPKDREIAGWQRSQLIEEQVMDPHSSEYEGLLAGLAFAREKGIDYIAVFSDSMTVVNQLTRDWATKDHLAKYCKGAREALDEFRGWQVSWVPREWNMVADDLVSGAFDGGHQIQHAED